MCGRFVSDTPPDELAQLMNAQAPTPGVRLDPNNKIAPSQFGAYGTRHRRCTSSRHAALDTRAIPDRGPLDRCSNAQHPCPDCRQEPFQLLTHQAICSSGRQFPGGRQTDAVWNGNLRHHRDQTSQRNKLTARTRFTGPRQKTHGCLSNLRITIQSALSLGRVTRADLPIDELLLDAWNPRHGEVEDQGAALERLVAGNPQQLRNLAEDIAENGLHPGLSFLVFPAEDGQFVVLDGNRRLAAIKLLMQPDTAPTSWRPITNEIKVDLASFQNLPCTILETREQGRLWLERMHTGQMNGVGVVQWPPIAQHRFSPRNDQRGRGAAALAWLSNHTEADASEFHQAIETVEGEITTFGRFVQTTAVRPILGYDFKGSELVPTKGTSDESLYERLIAAVRDLAGGKDVNDLRSIEQRVEYAHQLAGSSGGDVEGEPETAKQSVEDSNEPEGQRPAQDQYRERANQSESQQETKSKRRRRSSQPKTSVLETPLPGSYKSRIVQISEELCDLNVHKKPNAVAVLLRLLIEMTTEQCRREESLPREASLNEHIERVIQRVQTPQDEQDKVFHGVTVSLSTPNDRDHTKNFNQHVHNVDYHPVPTDLINTAANYQPYFERIAQHLAKKATG